MFEKRINIFTGHFGSGKTEVAVNYAWHMANAGFKSAIVDFDIVNPYFRTADAKAALEQKGIRVVLPMYANTNVDVPAIPAEIYSLFQDKAYQVVLDIGGDDVGAKAVSRFQEEIMSDDYEMYFVINTRRIMTDTPEKIVSMIEEIQYSANIPITKLVNNTNVLEFTTPEIVKEGMEKIQEVSKKIGVPVGVVAGMKDVVAPFGGSLNGIEVLELNKMIFLPWDRE